MIRFGGGVCAVGPVTLDRVDQTVFIGVRRFLGIGSLGLEVRLKLGSFPFIVRCSNFFIPILLYKIFKVFAVRGCRVGDVIVREPALKLGFVPFIVS